jgi:hypothetical protein
MKYTITIKGVASTNHNNLKELDGIDCQDCFSEYFDDTTYSNDVKGGFMYFSYEDGELYTVTIYNSNRELSDDELTELGEYTQGQWSDGIGEGFEQYSCMESEEGEEVFISPWTPGQELDITQNKKTT